MSERSLHPSKMTLVFVSGLLLGASWSGSVSGNGTSTSQGDHQIPEAKAGLAQGTPAPANALGSSVAKSEWSQKEGAGQQGEAPAGSAALPPGARTGQYFLPSGYFSVGSHDLGVFSAGQTVTVEVESTTSGMDLIAVVDEPHVTIDQGRFFADDDSGGGNDPALRFVAPVTGNYVLRVRDLNQRSGFYRYRVSTF